MEAIFARSWARVATGFGGGVITDALAGAGEALLSRYAETWRKYHTPQHLAECLEGFEAAIHLAETPAVLEAALWFHDAIYVPRSSDNEAQSAALATAVLAASGVTADVCAQVARLVMVTRHDALPSTPDEALLVDIDLSILGASTQRFAEYEQQVRAEYAFVPGMVFRHKRRQILESFQSRPRLYSTEFFHAHLEAQARINLAAAIAAC